MNMRTKVDTHFKKFYYFWQVFLLCLPICFGIYCRSICSVVNHIAINEGSLSLIPGLVKSDTIY